MDISQEKAVKSFGISEAIGWISWPFTLAQTPKPVQRTNKIYTALLFISNRLMEFSVLWLKTIIVSSTAGFE
jgi:hypothetical protein